MNACSLVKPLASHGIPLYLYCSRGQGIPPVVYVVYLLNVHTAAHVPTCLASVPALGPCPCSLYEA
jgi:hypothetical protein